MAALLVAGTLAVLAVPAIAAAQTSELATEAASETVAPATELPTEVAPLVAAVDGATVTLTWLDLEAVLYTVQRSADAGETFDDLAVVEGPLVTYVDADVPAGTYIYRVVADTTDPLTAPIVEVEVPVIDPGSSETPTEPTPEEPTPTVPRPGNDPAPQEPPDIPGLPTNSEQPGHGVEAPTLPKGATQDPHAAEPTGVRTAGADVEKLRNAKRLRLLPPRRLAGMISLSLPPQVAPAAPAPLVANPVIPASVAAAAMPVGPVIAQPPVVEALIPASTTEVPAAPIALALALLLATACGHVARRVVPAVARRQASGTLR